MALSRVAETIDSAPLRGARRIRRGLDLARADLNVIVTDLEAWIPLKDGQPNLQRETFYDVERDMKGEYVLAARVLLPGEELPVAVISSMRPRKPAAARHQRRSGRPRRRRISPRSQTGLQEVSATRSAPQPQRWPAWSFDRS